MTVIIAEATNVSGNLKITAALTVAAPAAPDLSAEIAAVTSLDVSCFIRSWNPEIQTNSGSAPPRVCTTAQMPVEGYSQFSAVELRYVYDPQAATSTDDNKARLMFAQGTEINFVVRKGLPFTTAWAAGQYSEVWKMRAGRQNYVRSGDDEFAEFEISQMFYPLAEPTHGQVVA